MSIVVCGRCGAKNRVEETASAAGGRRPICGRCGERLEAGGAQGRGGDAAASSGASTGGKPQLVSDATFARDVLAASETRPVLLDMWAEWCGPCRMIAPVLEQLAAESGGRYQIAKLNVDENPQTSARFQVQSIPTLLIFKQGQLVERLVGVQPKQTIAARLAAHV